MPSPRFRPDNLDFIFGVSNLDQYFILSLVLVQSILENNLWANQIQISIFYENWSPEQKKAYKKLIDNFNKSQGRDFVILNLFDVTKLEFEIQANYHGFNMNFRIEGIKYIKPISNWVFSIDSNEFNIRSLEPLISKLNQDLSDCWVVKKNDCGNFINFLDGTYSSTFAGELWIFNYKYLYQKNGIMEKYLGTFLQLQKTYPEFYDKIHLLTDFEHVSGIAWSKQPIGVLNFSSRNPISFDQIPESSYFLKWASRDLSPWHQEFPDNSLKKLWLEYASKNPMSKDFQIPFPDKFKDQRSSVQKKIDATKEWILSSFIQIYYFLCHLVSRVSLKMFRKMVIFYFKVASPKNEKYKNS